MRRDVSDLNELVGDLNLVLRLSPIDGYCGSQDRQRPSLDCLQHLPPALVRDHLLQALVMLDGGIQVPSGSTQGAGFVRQGGATR